MLQSESGHVYKTLRGTDYWVIRPQRVEQTCRTLFTGEKVAHTCMRILGRQRIFVVGRLRVSTFPLGVASLAEDPRVQTHHCEQCDC
jgi:hypothetical protein